MLEVKGLARAGALCSIAVVYIGSMPCFFLVFDMLIQEDEFELRCTLPVYNSLDGYGQSINQSHLKTTPLILK